MDPCCPRLPTVSGHHRRQVEFHRPHPRRCRRPGGRGARTLGGCSSDGCGVDRVVGLGGPQSGQVFQQTLWTGHKPTKRTFEMLCHDFSGWASESELLAHIRKLDEQKKAKAKKSRDHPPRACRSDRGDVRRCAVTNATGPMPSGVMSFTSPTARFASMGDGNATMSQRPQIPCRTLLGAG